MVEAGAPSALKRVCRCDIGASPRDPTLLVSVHPFTTVVGPPLKYQSLCWP